MKLYRLIDNQNVSNDRRLYTKDTLISLVRELVKVEETKKSIIMRSLA
jgi:hypothetical protein